MDMIWAIFRAIEWKSSGFKWSNREEKKKTIFVFWNQQPITTTTTPTQALIYVQVKNNTHNNYAHLCSFNWRSFHSIWSFHLILFNFPFSTVALAVSWFFKFCVSQLASCGLRVLMHSAINNRSWESNCNRI